MGHFSDIDLERQEDERAWELAELDAFKSKLVDLIQLTLRQADARQEGILTVVNMVSAQASWEALGDSDSARKVIEATMDHLFPIMEAQQAEKEGKIQ